MTNPSYPCFMTALGFSVEIHSKERLEFWVNAFLEAGASDFKFEPMEKVA